MTMLEKFNPARLKLFREEAGFNVPETIVRLGELGVTITAPTLHNWEKGIGSPNPDELRALAQIYKRDIKDFYYIPSETEAPSESQ